METIIVKLNIGRCLHHTLPTHDDDASVFELVDHTGSCVGEVWTTLRLAKEGREEPLEFLTINWGLSLSVAEIDEPFIPRWTFDSDKLPESEIFMSCRSFFEEALRPAPSKGLMGRYGVNSAQAEQPSVMKFLDALFTAKKGQPRPKFLWSTVNLILVEWDGPIARRLGMTSELGALLDLESDSWLTLAAASSATTLGGLPAFCMAAPLARYAVLMAAMRKIPYDQVFADEPAWARPIGIAQMALFTAATAPFGGSGTRAAVRSAAPIIASAQLLGMFFLYRRSQRRFAT